MAKLLYRQWPRRAGGAEQRRQAAFHARSIDRRQPQNRERKAGRSHRLLGAALRTAIGIGRRRRIALRQRMIGDRPILCAYRRHQDKSPDARLGGGGGQPRRPPAIDPIVGRCGYTTPAVLDAGKVDDSVNAFKPRTPVERLGEVRISRDFDAVEKCRGGQGAHAGAKRFAAIGERRDHGAAEETGRASDEHATLFPALPGSRLGLPVASRVRAQSQPRQHEDGERGSRTIVECDHG